MNATTASSTTSRYVDLRQQVIAVLRCLQVRKELVTLPTRTGRKELKPKCDELIGDLEALLNRWYGSVQDSCRTTLSNALKRYQADSIPSQRIANDIAKIAKALSKDPLSFLENGLTDSKSANCAWSISSWLRMSECLDATAALDHRIQSFCKTLTHSLQAQPTVNNGSPPAVRIVIERHQELEKELKTLHGKLPLQTTKMQRLFNQSEIQWASYCGKLIKEFLQELSELRRLVSNFQATDSPSPAITIPIEMSSLQGLLAVQDVSWVPAMLRERFADQDAPGGLRDICLANVDPNTSSSEGDCRNELVALICQSFAKLTSHLTSQQRDWLTTTCDAILKPIGLHVTIHEDPYFDNKEAIRHIVPVDAPRRLRQFGVSINDNQDRRWLVKQEIDEPEQRSRLEIKLREVARFGETNASLLTRSASDVVTLVLPEHLHDGQWKLWFSKLSKSERDVATLRLQTLLREAMTAQQTGDGAFSMIADQVLALMGEEGLQVRQTTTFSVGEGLWELQPVEARDRGEQTSVQGIRYVMPDTTVEDRTLVRIFDASPLATFLDREQELLRLTRLESLDWEGWRHYDTLLLGLTSHVSEDVERLQLALPWIEALIRETKSKQSSETTLLQRHLFGLLRHVAANTMLVPRLSSDAALYQPLQAADANSIDIIWESSAQPNGEVIRCEAISLLGSVPNDANSPPTVLRRGRVTVSLGPQFSASLKQTLELIESDSSLENSPDASGLPSFARALKNVRWNVGDFEAICEQSKNVFAEFCRSEEGRSWFNTWIHRLMNRSDSKFWYDWMRERCWFECFPEIDLEHGIAFWPVSSTTGLRNISVVASEEPIGHVVDVTSTYFSTRALKAETTLSLGNSPSDACLLASRIQAFVVSQKNDRRFDVLGKPLMRCVGSLRDPFFSARELSSTDLPNEIILEALDCLLKYIDETPPNHESLDSIASRCDEALKLLEEVAASQRMVIKPSGWSFRSATKPRGEITDENTVRDFGPSPRGELMIEQFGLQSETRMTRDCRMRLSLGLPPSGYDDLRQISAELRLIVQRQDWIQIGITRFEQAIEDLRTTLAQDDDPDPAFVVVELWQTVWLDLLPNVMTLDTNDTTKSRLSDRTRIALSKLATALGLTAYGESGRPINYLRGNIDMWFDYDPEKLSEASRITAGGIATIKVVDLPGLIRQDATSPLLRAKVRF